MILDKGKWAEYQLTEKEAIALAESGDWKFWDSEKIVRFQLFQRKLCMDFSAFHRATEEVLARPVFTHEFADRDRIVEEYLGTREAPTMEEIIDMLPKDKLVIALRKE
jgi:hypothetical protein